MNLNNNILRKAEITAKIKRIASITTNVLRKASLTCKIDLEEITPPEVVSATISFTNDNYQIGILFDRTLADIEPNQFDFAVTLSGGAVSVDTVAVEGLYCYLILNREVTYDETGSVTYTQSTPKLQSAEGFIVANFTESLVNSIEPAATAPVLQSITVEDSTPTKIIITFDLDLDETIIPDISDFSFSAKTGTGTVVVSAKTVTCTVTERYYWGDSGGTVTYTKGSNPITSTLGGEADSFTDEAITNNCALDAATTTLVAEGRYTTSPNDAVKALINRTIIDLKTYNGLSKADCCYVRGVHEALLGCQNWAKNAHNSTQINSPTFTAGQGFTGNGNTMGLNNNYTPSAEASQFALNDCTIIYMQNTIGTATARIPYGVLDDSNYRCYLFFYTSPTIDRAYINSTAYNNVGDLVNSRYVGYTRYLDPTAKLQAYHDGVATGSPTASGADAGLTQMSLYSLCYNEKGTPKSFSNGQEAFLWIGSGLTEAEHLGIVQTIQYFYANIGGVL